MKCKPKTLTCRASTSEELLPEIGMSDLCRANWVTNAFTSIAGWSTVVLAANFSRAVRERAYTGTCTLHC